MNTYISKLKNKIMNSNENSKTILNNAIGAILIKGGALIISLLTMPAYIEYFNNQQILGLWFTILSVLNWILTFDFGIGNGLRNHLVHALVRKDKLSAKRYISSAYIVISIIVLIVLFISTITFRYINWNMLFNIPISIVQEETLYITVFVVFVGIMLQFLFKIITSVLYALQKSALNNLLSLFSSIIIFVYVSIASSGNLSTNLITLAMVHVLAVNLPLLVTSIIVFSTNLKDSKPNIKYYGRKYAKDVMMLGGSFFWVQFMYMLITATNELLISWFSDPNMVVEYQIYNKLFTTMGILFTLALTPIWSAVTKALSEKNYSWIKKLYKTLKLMALLAVICEFLMIPFLQFGINLWLGDNTIRVNYLYAIIFAVFGSVFIWNGLLSSIVNGLGELKIQGIFFTIGAIIKIPIAWALVTVFDSWIGVIVANIIAMGLYCIIQPIWLSKFLNKKEFGDEKIV
ncbi:hypothetical protein RZN22_07995 [Bacillaceae bacterium S4-13-58]